MNEPQPLEPAPHWCDAAREVYESTASDYELTRHELEILHQACGQLHIAIRAGELAESAGLTVIDRYQQVKEHPAFGLQRRALNTYRLLLRELQLQGSTDPYEARRIRP